MKLLRLNRFSPARFLAGGFAAMIIAGTFLLLLPAATVTGENTFLNALFTAASAVCVTGLVVVNTGAFYSVFGQCIIMLLILGGALGFMTSATLIFILLGKKITLKDRLIIKEALNTENMQGLVRLVITIARMFFLVITGGSILLGMRFIPQMGWGKGLFFSFFHSASAFSNAGFDLFDKYQSLAGYADDYLVSGTILLLFIIGGLGFTVILEITQKKKFILYSLHTKIVLVFTLFLLLSGALLVYLLEYNNPSTLGGIGTGSQLFRAFFIAAAPRSGGFIIVSPDKLTTASLLLLLILMFIGASPASTGGGVKTTTFGLLAAGSRAMIMGSDELVLWEKRIPVTLILKALTIVFSSVCLIFLMVFVMTIIEDKPLLDLTFEVFSAFGTVGLTTGITPDLSSVGKVVIIFTMYAGRIGPLTMLYALTNRLKPAGVRYPEEKILIG
ncbi:MAG: TrkH family potassium uptake protein [Dethiobacteria bacterium]